MARNDRGLQVAAADKVELPEGSMWNPLAYSVYSLRKEEIGGRDDKSKLSPVWLS